MSALTDIQITPRQIGAYNALLLDLTRLAQERAMQRFHAGVLSRLRQLIDFDKAWWGRAALIDGLPCEHSTHLYNLPSHYLADWQTIRDQDPTVQRTHADPGHSVIIDTQSDASSPGLRWLGQRHGFRELLCGVHMDPQSRLSVHLALYRREGAAPFNAQERFLFDLCMPHLVAAEGLNQLRSLVTHRESLEGPTATALAVGDRHGLLHYAEPGFVDLLLGEWPQWNGPQLPDEVRPEGFSGRNLCLQSKQVGDLFLLSARRTPAMARLSAREAEIAQRFGSGRTYKEIARELGVAPNTVRHHIRSIYDKLGVNGKAGISQLLHRAPG